MVEQNHDLGDEFRTMYLVLNSRKHNTIANIYHKGKYNYGGNYLNGVIK
jgi:hypothetical protein